MLILFLFGCFLYLVNLLSYKVLNKYIASQHRFDLNICCGKTEYGRINADIMQHDEAIKGFVLVDDIYRLPFGDQQFEKTLCAHTLEHVDDPQRFDAELRRVSAEVMYIVPPIWDVGAQLNFWEHKWITVAVSKVHTKMPLMVRNPLSVLYGLVFRQVVRG